MNAEGDLRPVPQYRPESQWACRNTPRIATELVENTIVHTTSRPRLRLELRGGAFTVAGTSRVRGCSRSWTGGEVVRAVLARRGRSHHEFGG
ncbi:hypothetical protein [Amycolatopsis mediterranei]|uniref:hypothetical protein n=1 Tax=Amycolatopsis mediterranei TaxID=33910 RepID=UPI00049F6EEF|nr:hypothetical protein DV26_35275 [Amycolatopsis mediterranei]KDU88906.1 hypothetical protein DV36_28610 [Amycolatopsis mediterranei]